MGFRIERRYWLPIFLLMASSVQSQEGFPLDGTWRGEWRAAGAEPNRVVILMKWDAETVTGRINPGPNSIDFSRAWLEPSDWTVHIEAESAAGEPIRIEGKLNDIGSYNRTIAGSWTQADTVSEFNIRRE
jgi:hypothetical protein